MNTTPNLVSDRFLLWTSHSASPVGSLQMQIPVTAVFYDICSCFPAWPWQVSHRGLANQDGKWEMGGQVALSAVSVVPRPPSLPPPILFPPDHGSAICAPINHFHSPIPLPISLCMLDEDIAPHLCLLLEHLLLSDDSHLWRVWCCRRFCVNWVKETSHTYTNV